MAVKIGSSNYVARVAKRRSVRSASRFSSEPTEGWDRLTPEVLLRRCYEHLVDPCESPEERRNLVADLDRFLNNT